MNKVYAILLVLTFSTAASKRFLTDPEGTRFYVKDSRIVDEAGRQRLFHGQNVVHKLFPFHPRTDAGFNSLDSFVEEDMNLFHELGFNSIRLGCAWAGAEPVEGQWNTSFFDVVEGIVNKSAEYGIYTLLDHHQDAFSTKVCGTGFPSWTVANTDDKWLYRVFLGRHAHFPEPLSKAFDLRGLGPVELAPGTPNRTLCLDFTTRKHGDFPMLHATFQTALSYEEVYDNKDGRLDKWAAFWGKVASRFGKHRNMLGFELSNEPFAGDFYSHPFNMLPWNADRNRLQSVFDRLATSVRENGGEESLIFFESVTWEVGSIGEREGFLHAPGGPQYANRSVLSFHNSVDRKLAPDARYYHWRDKEAQRLGVAGMVTETKSSVLDLADEFAQTSVAGWMQWAYKKYADWTWDTDGLFKVPCAGSIDACVNVQNVGKYTRLYPQAIAGVLLSTAFEPSSGAAHVVFRPDYSISKPTVIYVPTMVHYPDGFNIEVRPAGCADWEFNETTKSTYVSVRANQATKVELITVNFTRKSKSTASDNTYLLHV